jgi:cell division transport system permease protein
MRAWLRQHRLALVAATRKWLAQRAAALLNALALGVALALPAGGYALLEGLHGLSTRSAIDPQLSVFMRTDVGPEAAQRLAELAARHERPRGRRRRARVQSVARHARGQRGRERGWRS